MAIKTLITDYNGSWEPKYLEILLSYALKNHYKSADKGKYKKLKEAEREMITKFFKKGSDAVFDDFIEIVLKGEPSHIVDSSMKKIANDHKAVLPWYIRLGSDLFSGKGKYFTGDVDPDAKRVFEAAKKKGLTTGIYSRSLIELIEPYLEGTGQSEYFDFIEANKLTTEEGIITGKTDDVGMLKLGLLSFLSDKGLRPEETAFIDNADIDPLMTAGMGIAAPGSKEEFRKDCEKAPSNYDVKKTIETPENWKEVGDLLGLW